MTTYQLLIRLLSPLITILIILDAIKRKAGWRFIQQRLGFAFKNHANTSSAAIWVHCASVGEVKAVEQLIKSLPSQQPVIITTNTPTGAALANSLFSDQIQHAFCPFDWPFAIKGFLRCYQPKALWVVETEIWPNLYRLTKQHGINIHLINARLSKKTLNSPSWLKQTYQRTLSYVDQVLARSEIEAQRFIAMGLSENKVNVLGNLKYAGLANLPNYAKPIQSEYVLAASTHKDEELALVTLWKKLERKELLVIVPRHPKRTSNILQQLKPYRHELAVYSLNESISEQTRFYLDDQIGVLMPLYQHAKIVIMGGAFTPKGGHNVLEPAALKATIITGSDMSDFEAETELLKSNNGLIQVEDYDELEKTLPNLLSSSDTRAKLGNAAYEVIQNQQFILKAYQDQLF